HPHRPSRRVALWWRPPVRVRTIRLNLRRRLAFISVAERAKPPFQFHSVTGKVGWTLGAISRNNYPPAYNRIFSEFRQRLNPFNKRLSRFKDKPAFYDTGKAFRNSSIRAIRAGWTEVHNTLSPHRRVNGTKVPP